jgi:hypothetical protein
VTKHALWLGVVVVLAATAPARAQNKEVTDLLPAETLACLELRQPDRLAREVAALIQGSRLDDLPKLMAQLRGQSTERLDWMVRERVGVFGLFLSPEVLNEAGRLQGGTVALTGFAKDGSPEIIGILQSGDSNAPGLYMRAYLTFSDAAIMGEVEGVTLYRERRVIYRNFKGKEEVPQQEVRETGPVMATLPGMLLFGSSTEVVKDVIRRYKGKNADAALSGVRAFRDAAALRDRPGLFAYADVEALAGQIDNVVRQQVGRRDPTWSLVRTLLNPKALHGLTASLTLHNSNLELRAQLRLDGREKSPLLDLLPDKAARLDTLQFTPRASLLALTLDLSDGEKRWEKILVLIDALAKQMGESDLNLPSKKIAELEDALGMKFGKDLMARIAGIALAGVPATSRDGMPPVQPFVVVQATDAEAARFLEEKGLTRLLSLLNPGGEEKKSAKKTEIDGQVVYSLPLERGTGTVHFGRRGTSVVLALDGQTVANALKAGSKKEGLLSEEKTARAIKDVDGSLVVGVVSLGQVFLELFKGLEPAPKVLPRDGLLPPPPDVDAPPKPQREPNKLVPTAAKAVADLPPAIVSVSRKADLLLLEIKQPALKSASAKVINVWVDAELEGLTRQRTRPGFGEKKEIKKEAIKEIEKKEIEKKEPEKKEEKKD